jgi:hypothetical protein
MPDQEDSLSRYERELREVLEEHETDEEED